MIPTLQIGPLAIQTAGLFLILSIWVGMTLAEKRATSHGLQPDALDNLILFSLFGFILGGRLAYVGLHFNNFLASPLDVFSLNTALFDLPGGLAAALIAGLIVGQRRKLPFWPALDALTPFLAALMVGIAASHLASGNAFGKPTSLPWGMEIYGAVRHPSQVYEVAAALFILGLVGWRVPVVPPGGQFLIFIASTAGAALFLEAFRGDSALVLGGLRLEQILAWLILAGALYALDRLQSVKRLVENQ